MARSRYSVLRDPVHGDVYLTHEELSVLDTPEVQRLRGVRQLGTAYLVYPGAQHTRFEHMIGTAWMASRMIEGIERNRALAPGSLLAVGADEERLVRLAALLHDVSHVPFGHNIEDQTGLFERHDTPERIERALGRGRLGERLDELGVREEVLGILGTGPARDRVPRCWRQILSDTLCADIFDYLRRDAYYTGLRLGYDERLLSVFRIDRATGLLYVDLAKRGMVREDVLSEIVRLLEARYHFSERVYYHHAKIAAGALVAKAVEEALLSGAVRPEDFHDLTDDSLLSLLEGIDLGDEERNARVRRLVARFRSRSLLKRAAVFPRYANRAVQSELLQRFFGPGRHEERSRFEREVAEEAARTLRRDVEVLLYFPSREMQLKEAGLHVLFPEDERPLPLCDRADRVPRLRDLEDAYRDLWKCYVFSSETSARGIAAVARAAERRLPGAVNAYRPH